MDRANATASAKVTTLGLALTPTDIADRLDNIRRTYDSPGDGRTVVADGFGCKVLVRNGELLVFDGVGADNRRERQYPKISAPERLLIMGDGYVTTESLQWLKTQQVALIVLGHDREVVLAASPAGKNDPRMRRALATAPWSGAGMAIVRHLLKTKLANQGEVLRQVFEDEATGATLLDLAEGIAVARDAAEAMQLEAVGAAAYFAVWANHPATIVNFVTKDRKRIPPHWRVFDSRRSAITGASNTNRMAERPLNGILNLLYKLGEIEARFALVRLSLDPGLGVVHSDAVGRDSLALDLLEPIRPTIDRFALELIAERSFHKRDFVERSDGHVRLAAPLSHEIVAATMPVWAKEIAPHAEAVAGILNKQIAGKVTPSTPLTGGRARMAQAAVRARKAAQKAASDHRTTAPVRRPRVPTPRQQAALFATCVDCGGPLARSRHVRCPSCWEAQPAQSREARRRRGRSIAMARSELEAWKAEHPHANADPAQFAVIRHQLAGVLLSQIMAATGVSKATASSWRSGRHTPALRHWPALAELAAVKAPKPR